MILRELELPKLRPGGKIFRLIDLENRSFECVTFSQ